MKALILLMFFIPGLSLGQVKSQALTCDCVVDLSSESTCNIPSKVPFSITFSGRTAVMKMREYDYRLSFKEAFVDPSGVRNSVYVKNGEVTVITTFPVAGNFAMVFTHPKNDVITMALCR